MSEPPRYPVFREGSRVVQFNETTRAAHLLGIMYYTTLEDLSGNGTLTRLIDKKTFYDSVASFLAWKQFNERRGDILPHLPNLIGDCDFRWTYEFRDSQSSPLFAAKQLFGAMSAGLSKQNEHPEKWPRIPYGILGAWWSGISKPTSQLGTGYELPQNGAN